MVHSNTTNNNTNNNSTHENVIYGYIRVSTKQQSLQRQYNNITKLYPNAIIIQEKFTGTSLVGRVQFLKLLKKVKPGDTIVFDSVSRMSRDAQDGVNTYFELFNKGVHLVFLKEPYINTSVYTERLNNNTNFFVDDETLNNTIIKGIREYFVSLAKQQIEIAFNQSEKEVQDLRQRVKEGMKIAALNGATFGGKRGVKKVTDKSIKAKKLIKRYNKEFNGKFNDKETLMMINGKSKDFSISKTTYYKYKEELILDSLTAEERELVLNNLNTKKQILKGNHSLLNDNTKLN